MSYITLLEIKDYLGIPAINTTQDVRLASLLVTSQSMIESVIGDITLGAKMQDIHICDIKYRHGGAEIKMLCSPVVSITSIDGKTYTGVLGTDYKIITIGRSRYVWIWDMGDYITDSVSGYITIVYQAGLSPTDPDYARLQLIQKMMVALEYAKKDGQTLKMYKLGPRQFEFADTSANKDLYSSISGLLNTFILHDVH